ncbi:MAG: phenylacetate--CoA ligase [Deltaproteobacteria bacterium]|nr:phenylacetate--CoA ligase [Candidatus Zymogenaceae bacterium]
MRIWDEKNETMSREELKQFQLEGLQKTINRIIRHNVTFYRHRFDQVGFNIEKDAIESIEDLSKLPFITREDLKESYPYDLFAVHLRDVVRIHAASGDVGITGFTMEDLKSWSRRVARTLCSAGLDEDDVLQIALSYGLFPGAFGYHYAAENIGASVIPTSTTHIKRQLRILQDYKSTAIVSTPSYILRLIREMKDNGINPKHLSLKYAILGAEPWTDDMRREIEENLYVSAYFHYGVESVFGPGIASECREKNGLHIFEDHFIPEIIDTKTGKSLPYGEEGELVLTTLTMEAFPLIRYRTGDVTRLYLSDDVCPCGRTHIKMDPVKRRYDDLIVFRGINLYPYQIQNILKEIIQDEPRFRIVLYRENGDDLMDIQLEITENIFHDEMKVERRFIRDVEHRILHELGFEVSIRLIENDSLPDGELIEDKR